MKGFGPWAKANIWIVVSIVVVIIAMPVSIFFSQRWNADIVKRATDDIRKTMGQLDGIVVTYDAPALLPGGAAYEQRMTPNPTATQEVSALRRERATQANRLREIAVERSAAGKTLIVDEDPELGRLFPEPRGDSERIRLAKLFIDGWRDAHEALLEQHRIGMPPDPELLLTQLQQLYDQQVDVLRRGRQDPVLSEDEIKEVRESMTNARLKAYRDRAMELSYYGSIESLPSVTQALAGYGEDGFQIPTVEQLWEWQEDYWLHKSVIEALTLANQRPGSAGALSAPAAPVKRLLSLTVRPVGQAASGGGAERPSRGRGRGNDDDAGGGGGAPVGDGSAPIEPDYSIAHTGRAGFPTKNNGLYDVRYIDVELLADANRVPQIVDAIGRTDFMTVIDMDASYYNPYADQSAGFDYGGDFVVRLSLTIESVQFRAWRADRMPASLRTKLGIPDPQPASGEGEDGSGEDGGN